ncbi:MAG: BamA/TamA family outer membrane protein [Opitutaceae bacterium]|nr:BamA/TamA family outer membrane protein [Opitutaceae bacterium]
MSKGGLKSTARVATACAVSALACILVSPSACAADKPAEGTALAEIEVKGLGFFGNREQRTSLMRLLGPERGAAMDANAIEDAAFLLVSALAEEGFLHPRVTATLSPDGSNARAFEFDETLSTVLPRPLSAGKVEFAVAPGVRSTIATLRFEGLQAIPAGDAEAYYRPVDSLWKSAASRALSPARLRRSDENLRDGLRLLGFAESEVHSRAVRESPEGKAEILVEVKEGPRFWVRRVSLAGVEGTGIAFDVRPWSGAAWTPLWQRDLGEAIRGAAVGKGHPDAEVSFKELRGGRDGDALPVDVFATLEAGDLVTLGAARFEGNRHTKEAVLKRRVRLKPGTPLNLLDVETARLRLARLGVFSTVRTELDPPSGPERGVTFRLKELPRWESNVLLGYGSYEQLRGGIEWRQTNLFGRAHQSRLLLVQSMKSTRGDLQYSVPELFGETIDGAARLFGLRREETSFDREEYGASVALRKRLGRGMEGRIGYTYQSLRNRSNELTTRVLDERRVTVGSVETGVTLDRRDNPLRPRRGYHLFAQIEAASKLLAGEVDYQIYEVGGSYHTAWGRTRWIHLGLSHGAITTMGSPSDRFLPVNKRFFPGGDSSIRGYQRGEAAPRGADGRFIGAKSRVTLNAEIEQQLTTNWSAVVFLDALGTAVSLADYPFDERLCSVGLGVRYQTIVGPLRLEYGHNLRRRDGDPEGTLHFSVGFPF